MADRLIPVLFFQFVFILGKEKELHLLESVRFCCYGICDLVDGSRTAFFLIPMVLFS